MFRIESDGPHSGTCELEDRTKHKQKLKLIKDVVKEIKDRKKKLLNWSTKNYKKLVSPRKKNLKLAVSIRIQSSTKTCSKKFTEKMIKNIKPLQKFIQKKIYERF